MTQSGDSQVKISHPDGIEMPFSENIAAYLMERKNKSEQFYFSDWVGSLSNELVTKMIQLGESIVLSDGDMPFDDLLQTMVIAVAIEKREQKVAFSNNDLDGWINQVLKIASVEVLKRNGAIEAVVPMGLSINPEGSITVTDLGMQLEEEFRKKMN